MLLRKKSEQLAIGLLAVSFGRHQLANVPQNVGCRSGRHDGILRHEACCLLPDYGWRDRNSANFVWQTKSPHPRRPENLGMATHRTRAASPAVWLLILSENALQPQNEVAAVSP